MASRDPEGHRDGTREEDNLHSSIESGDHSHYFNSCPGSLREKNREAIARVAEVHATNGFYHRAAEAYVGIRDFRAVLRIAVTCLKRDDVMTAADICALLLSDSEAAASLYGRDEAVTTKVLRRRVRFLLGSRFPAVHL